MIIEDSKALGTLLRKRRRDLGYTQAYISEVSGLSVSFISDVENGKGTVEFGKVLYLANLLGADIIFEARE